MKSVFLAFTNNMACHGTSTVFTIVKNKYTERARVRKMYIVKSTLLINTRNQWYASKNAFI